MRVTPGAQAAPQSGPPPGAPPQGGQQGPSPEQAIQMIQLGFQSLAKMIQAAGQNLPPDDIKLFQAAAQATDALIQSLTGPAQGQEGPQQPPGRPAPSEPMAANANAGSRPAGPQGR